MEKSRTAYLTIDDAPTDDFIKKIDYLESKNIPAIFYCCGKDLDKYFDLALEGLKRGFIMGNHSYSHEHFSSFTKEKAFEEIKKTDVLIEKLYAEAGREVIKTFRFPYGDKGWGDGPQENPCPNDERREYADSIQNYLAELGYKQPKFENITYQSYHDCNMLKDIDVYWTYDCKEWEYHFNGVSKEDILGRMDKDDKDNWLGLNSGDSSEIVLLHDHLETSPIFEDIIEKLLTKNLEFKLPEFS